MSATSVGFPRIALVGRHSGAAAETLVRLARFLAARGHAVVLEEEYQRLARAARIRGFRAGTDLHTYRTYAYLVGMLFVRAADRAERVRNAMLCRGFNGQIPAPPLAAMGQRDHLFLILWGAVFLLLRLLDLPTLLGGVLLPGGGP